MLFVFFLLFISATDGIEPDENNNNQDPNVDPNHMGADDNYDTNMDEKYRIYRDDDLDSNYNCTGKNVIKVDEACECAPGYIYGDPYTNTGCWNCSIPCHENAFCEKQDHCECFSGYVGDGIKKCDSILPILVSFEPKRGNPNGGTKVKVVFESKVNNDVKAVFCRFGLQVVEARSVKENKAVCVSPKANSQEEYYAPFAISFDQEYWSLEKSAFIYYVETSGGFNAILIVFVFMGMIVGVIVTVVYKMNRHVKGYDRDERVPFLNKAHSSV